MNELFTVKIVIAELSKPTTCISLSFRWLNVSTLITCHMTLIYSTLFHTIISPPCFCLPPGGVQVCSRDTAVSNACPLGKRCLRQGEREYCASCIAAAQFDLDAVSTSDAANCLGLDVFRSTSFGGLGGGGNAYAGDSGDVHVHRPFDIRPATTWRAPINLCRATATTATTCSSAKYRRNSQTPTSRLPSRSASTTCSVACVRARTSSL